MADWIFMGFLSFNSLFCFVRFHFPFLFCVNLPDALFFTFSGLFVSPSPAATKLSIRKRVIVKYNKNTCRRCSFDCSFLDFHSPFCPTCVYITHEGLPSSEWVGAGKVQFLHCNSCNTVYGRQETFNTLRHVLSLFLMAQARSPGREIISRTPNISGNYEVQGKKKSILSFY